MKKVRTIPNPLPPSIEVKLARLASFTELNPRPIIEVSTRGKVIDVNKSAELLFPDLETKGKRHPYLSKFSDVLKYGRNKEKPFVREIKNGETWFRQIFYYIPKFKLFHVFGSDITDRKQAEIALARSELRYRSLFNKMSEAYVLFEMIENGKGNIVDGKFLDTNPAFEKLANVKKSHIIGKTIKQILPTEYHAWIKEFGKVATTGKPMHVDYHDKRYNKYYEVFAHKPEEMQTAVLLFDITDRHKIMEEKDNFISIMSHELRNPLTPILTSAQFLNSLNLAAHPIVREYAQIIERQAKTMARLLDDLLDTSRMAHKKILLDKKIVDAGEIVKNAVETTLPHVRTQEQSLSVTIPKTPRYVEGDSVRLEQVVVNLITNAVKYTRPKGHIWIKVSRTGNWVHITVQDNGVGIRKDKIKRIFELFQTADQLPFADLGSIGIGLNITKQLVSMHGGKITVTSKGENKGSTFLVRLPSVVFKEKSKTTKSSSHIPAHIKNKRILIADDQKDIANLLSRILAAKGYEIATVYNGLDAITTFKTFKPEVALIDIRMAGMTGYEVAKTLKQQKNGHTATLIAMTGFGQAKDKKLSKEAGFEHHLTKPLDMESLGKLIASL